MIASLPMYATPLTADADARFWGLIRDRLRKAGIAAPDALSQTPGDLMDHWRDPRLVLSQTCGLPYRATLKDQVALIGTPDFGITGCPPGHYCSVVIARSDDTRKTLSDFATARFAFNDPMSQSGWAALAMEAPEVLRGARLQTGSHRASALAVRTGKADFAALDAVTWRDLYAASALPGLQIIHTTPPTPGLPYIAAMGMPADAIFDAVRAAIVALSPDDRAILHLRDLIALPQSAYLLPLPPAPATIPA